MLQYVDSFYCAYNSASHNVVIRLRQEEPFENGQDGKVQSKMNEVDNIIMSRKCAEQLANSLLSYFPKIISICKIQKKTDFPLKSYI